MTRPTLKLSALAALISAFALFGCPGPAGIPTLTVSASPRQIDDKGQSSKISVDYVPPQTERYEPHEGESWITVAAMYKMNPADLIRLNFGTVQSRERSLVTSTTMECRSLGEIPGILEA